MPDTARASLPAVSGGGDASGQQEGIMTYQAAEPLSEDSSHIANRNTPRAAAAPTVGRRSQLAVQPPANGTLGAHPWGPLGTASGSVSGSTSSAQASAPRSVVTPRRTIISPQRTSHLNPETHNGDGSPRPGVAGRHVAGSSTRSSSTSPNTSTSNSPRKQITQSSMMSDIGDLFVKIGELEAKHNEERSRYETLVKEHEKERREWAKERKDWADERTEWEGRLSGFKGRLSDLEKGVNSSTQNSNLQSDMASAEADMRAIQKAATARDEKEMKTALSAVVVPSMKIVYGFQADGDLPNRWPPYPDVDDCDDPSWPKFIGADGKEYPCIRFDLTQDFRSPRNQRAKVQLLRYLEANKGDWQCAVHVISTALKATQVNWVEAICTYFKSMIKHNAKYFKKIESGGEQSASGILALDLDAMESGPSRETATGENGDGGTGLGDAGETPGASTVSSEAAKQILAKATKPTKAEINDLQTRRQLIPELRDPAYECLTDPRHLLRVVDKAKCLFIRPAYMDPSALDKLIVIYTTKLSGQLKSTHDYERVVFVEGVTLDNYPWPRLDYLHKLGQMPQEWLLDEPFVAALSDTRKKNVIPTMKPLSYSDALKHPSVLAHPFYARLAEAARGSSLLSGQVVPTKRKTTSTFDYASFQDRGVDIPPISGTRIRSISPEKTPTPVAYGHRTATASTAASSSTPSTLAEIEPELTDLNGLQVFSNWMDEDIG